MSIRSQIFVADVLRAVGELKPDPSASRAMATLLLAGRLPAPTKASSRATS